MNPVIAKQRLRELARMRPEGHKVLSLYLNLDPSEFPTPRDRSTEFESLLDVADDALRNDGLDHAQKEALKRDLERLRSWYEKEFDASGTRGVVVFTSSGAGLFEVVQLPEPIPSEVVIDDSPFIEPLTTSGGRDGYGVLLIDRQLARILVGSSAGLRELSRIVDDVHGWHDQGGWSQARYQRGILKEARDHIKHAAEELFSHFKRGTVQRLVIGTHGELRGEIESRLHNYLKERIVGWIDVDVRAAPAQVAKEVAAIIEQDEKKREHETVERLRSELGRNARGAAGLADVLEALNERRVETLLVQERFQASGYASPSSDFLSTEPGSSPAGEQLEQRDDILEPAVESALMQSAEILVVRHHPDLEPLGSIGALLRF
jgi:peptide chain release factor subunit 1